MAVAAPLREALQHQRQQHRIVIAFGKDREFGAAVDRADEVGQRVGEAVEAQQIALGPESRPGHALGIGRPLPQRSHQKQQCNRQGSHERLRDSIRHSNDQNRRFGPVGVRMERSLAFSIRL